MIHSKLRCILVTCLITLGLASSFGLAQSKPGPVSTDQDVTLTFYSYSYASAGPTRDGIQKLIDEFEARHPNIDVEPVGIPAGDLMARLQAETVAGAPPDVAQLFFNDLGFIAESLNVKALEEFVPPDELEAHLAGLHPNGVKLGQLNGQTYGLAFTFSTPILFYNADLFREAGLNPEQPPTTWDEVKAYGQQINERTGKYGIFITTFGAPYASFDWLFQGLVRSNGGRVLSKDRSTPMFGESEAVGTVEMLRDLVSSGVMPGVELTGTDATDAFQAGNIAMLLESSASQSRLLSAAEGNYELRAAQMPAFGERPAVPTNSGSALFVFADDPLKQQAAWEFMKFVTSERGYTIITQDIGYLPLRTDIVDDPQYLQGWVAEHPFVHPNLDQLDRLEPWESFPGPSYRQIVTIMMGALEEAVYSDGDPAAIMQAAQNRASALMP